MLHEVLLALSGHPSPIFKEPGAAHDHGNAFQSLLSPSESALLECLGRLATLHRNLREHAEWIATHHQSIICRAVATRIQQCHLKRFQKKILEVEGKILSKDATIVGAYDIVPLARVVGEFDEWHRLLQWLWDLACMIRSPGEEHSDREKTCTGAMVINHLRSEANTGFPEIEKAAIELSKVAETAWLRQLCSWLLYGRVPAHGARDFFIQHDSGDGGGFIREKALLPGFVSPGLANSIKFVGKSLHQVQQHQQHTGTLKGSATAALDERELVSANMKQLAALSLPIVPAQLARAVSAIKLSLSQNLLQHLLPLEETLKLLGCLRRYFLLGQGEFAVALIQQAEARLLARQQSMGRLLQQDPVKALQGLSLKDAELHQALVATWKILTRYEEDGEDAVFEFATKQMTLQAPAAKASRPVTSDSVSAATPQVSPVEFNDLLFPTATLLGLEIEAPFDLFISAQDVEIYASINRYLLAIRRAEVRLSELWRRTAARRDHPSPTGRSQAPMSREAKTRLTKRSKETRKVWATCSAANFLISETAAYFEGEIVKESCEHFEAWIRKPAANGDLGDSIASRQSAKIEDEMQRDPETLATAHRSFLASLVYSLLLSDMQYTRELRSLLGNIDALIAFFNRLLDVQQKLDLEESSGGDSFYSSEEEQRTAVSLDRARKKVDSDLRSVVNRLRQLDHERIGSARYYDGGVSESGFEPWKGGGTDRLLMKLEFGRMTDEGFDIV